MRLLTVSAVLSEISEPSVPVAREEADSGVPHLLLVSSCVFSEVCFCDHQHVWVVQPNESGDIPGVRVQPVDVVGPSLGRRAAARERRVAWAMENNLFCFSWFSAEGSCAASRCTSGSEEACVRQGRARRSDRQYRECVGRQRVSS
ncbi:hypothetical protein FOA52_011282 [Chlamydomonas sp. UWO 241]|nr:hypothetical protein FOA52_011282 [Chlamydomonas sp. UWO 241]